jgi:hypothetical protein
MFLALIGAIVAVATLARLHDRQLALLDADGGGRLSDRRA